MALDGFAGPVPPGPAALDDGRVLAPFPCENQFRLQLGRHGDARDQAAALAENLASLSEALPALRLLAFDAANLAEELECGGAQ
jgi:hypothetical protein